MIVNYINKLINDFLTVGIPLKNKRVTEAKKAIEPYLHDDEKYLIYELKDRNIKVKELEFIVNRYGIDRNEFIDESYAEMRNLQGDNNKWG